MSCVCSSIKVASDSRDAVLMGRIFRYVSSFLELIMPEEIPYDDSPSDDGGAPQNSDVYAAVRSDYVETRRKSAEGIYEVLCGNIHEVLSEEILAAAIAELDAAGSAIAELDPVRT